MSRDTKIENVQRLQTAHNKTKKMHELEPETRELHPGTDIARNWTVITASYSGLEQTLKYLIADQSELSIAELIALANTRNTNAIKECTKKYPFRTHNLGWLFSKLDRSTQEVVREFYDRYRSLHSYLSIGNVDQFLNTVSGPKGAGYERWRYTLIEDKPLPKNSPEALLAIWGVCIQIAYGRVWGNQRVQMPDKELALEFCEQMDSLHLSVSVERQNAGEPFQDLSREIRDWLWRGGHPLNAFAEVLWHYARHGCHGAQNVSEWLSETLTRWVEDVMESSAVSRRTSLRAFINRAQGYTTNGRSIRWNRKKNRFETVRWSLQTRYQENLPPQAIMIGDLTWRGTPLNTLWVAAEESGYRVFENRGFKGPSDKEIWFRILELRTEGVGRLKPVLSVWQKRENYKNLYYIIEECARDEMSPSVRRWIDLARRLGEVRANGVNVEWQ